MQGMHDGDVFAPNRAFGSSSQPSLPELSMHEQSMHGIYGWDSAASPFTNTDNPSGSQLAFASRSRSKGATMISTNPSTSTLHEVNLTRQHSTDPNKSDFLSRGPLHACSALRSENYPRHALDPTIVQVLWQRYMHAPSSRS